MFGFKKWKKNTFDTRSCLKLEYLIIPRGCKECIARGRPTNDKQIIVKNIYTFFIFLLFGIHSFNDDCFLTVVKMSKQITAIRDFNLSNLYVELKTIREITWVPILN